LRKKEGYRVGKLVSAFVQAIDTVTLEAIGGTQVQDSVGGSVLKIVPSLL
jgi:hypothetical protein